MGLGIDDWGNRWGITLDTRSKKSPKIRINVGRIEIGVLLAPYEEEVSGFLVISNDFKNVRWLTDIAEETERRNSLAISRRYVWLDNKMLDFVARSKTIEAVEFRQSAKKLVKIELANTQRMHRKYNYPELTKHLIGCGYFAEISHSLNSVVDNPRKFREGDRRLRLHSKVERNPKFRITKLFEARRTYGSLRCEACMDLMVDKYFTDDIVEVHHIDQLAKGGERFSETDDAAILCRNCHRAIHILIERNADELATRENNYAPIFSEKFQNQRNKQK